MIIRFSILQKSRKKIICFYMKSERNKYKSLYIYSTMGIGFIFFSLVNMAVSNVQLSTFFSENVDNC